MDEVERINMARAEINAAINNAGAKYQLPPYILELIINGALSDVRGQTNIIDTVERRKAQKEQKNVEEPKEDEARND